MGCLQNHYYDNGQCRVGLVAVHSAVPAGGSWRPRARPQGVRRGRGLLGRAEARAGRHTLQQVVTMYI